VLCLCDSYGGNALLEERVRVRRSIGVEIARFRLQAEVQVMRVTRAPDLIVALGVNLRKGLDQLRLRKIGRHVAFLLSLERLLLIIL